MTERQPTRSNVDPQEQWYSHNIGPKNAVVADVGANVGRLSQFFWEQGGGTCEIVSIEPLSENIAAITKRIEQSGANNWTVQPFAAFDHDGELELSVFPEPQLGWNATVVKPGQRGRIVSCRRLSGMVPNATIVKIDVEGHEYAILSESLDRLVHVHTWALELHMVAEHPLETTLRSFVDRGFSLVAAGRTANNASGAWMNVPVGPELSWARIPVAQIRHDGSIFKMLHVIARR